MITLIQVEDTLHAFGNPTISIKMEDRRALANEHPTAEWIHFYSNGKLILVMKTRKTWRKSVKRK